MNGSTTTLLAVALAAAAAGCEDESETRQYDEGELDTDTMGGNPGDWDGDGFGPEQGDCDDFDEHVNPNAVEDLGQGGGGDGVDNDCDGQTDEVEVCDANPVGATEADMAAAINLCDERFLLGAQKISSASAGVSVAFDTLASQGYGGCLVAQQGAEMSAVSTGEVGQANPNDAEGIDGLMSGADISVDPLPDYQGDQPTGSQPYQSCDLCQLRLDLTAPSNAYGFSFDFVFGSAEYDEWIEQGFNDTFYAILEHAALNGGATTNIAFDDNGSEIEVDTNFFENPLHPCDESGSGWEPAVSGVSGSTGWLRTSWNVVPGSTFHLTFSIHDEGDCIFDSIVFLDNFRWSTEPVEQGTTPIVE